MKKFFFVAAIALVSLFCISANAESTETAPVENYVSSVTATIAGMDGEIDLDDYITLNVPPRAFSNVPLQIWSL